MSVRDVYIGDVSQLLTKSSQSFDAILLDVDNGPEGLTHSQNELAVFSRRIKRSL